MTKLVELQNTFKEAIIKGAKLIAVKIKLPNYQTPEIIINENANFMEKLSYYEKAYDEDLHLKSCNDIVILDVVYGENSGTIIDTLLKKED